ncbi:thiolase family protein [Staphylococcus aureus]
MTRRSRCLAVRSHQRAYDAQRDGRFKDEIIPIQVNSVEYTNAGPKSTHKYLYEDEFIRPDTTMVGLAKLRTRLEAALPLCGCRF